MAQGTPVSYEVTGVTQDVKFTDRATPTNGKRVNFTTTTGYTGSVFVPDGVFTDLSAVRTMIEDEVRTVAAAQQISGSVS